MLLTVEEAKTLVCPIGFGSETGCACVAKGCPVWRWNEKEREGGGYGAIRKGFCGLGGKPEF